MKPREFFPNMPDEVFSMWINPLVKAKGWPFKSIDDDLQATEWKYLLGLDQTLRDWANCTWFLIDLNRKETRFANSSVKMLEAIIGHCAFGQTTMTANLVDTKDRFRACTSFYRRTGTIPLPIIVKRIGNGFEIIDGHHRVAAIVHVGIPGTPYLIIVNPSS